MDELGEKGYQKCILDDWAGALSIWDEAIKRYPKEKRFYNNRALCYLHKKEYKRALEDARYMTSNFPKYVKGHFREGEILAAMGRYEEAYRCFCQVIDLDQNCMEAFSELAEVQIQMLRKKGFSRYQAGCAIQVASNLAEAERILRGGSIKESDLYFSEDDELQPTANYDPFEDASNPKKCCSLWVGNLTETINDVQLTNLFKRFGEVKSAKLHSGSQGFVNFVHHESASKAMKELQGADVAGNKKIKIRWPDKAMLRK